MRKKIVNLLLMGILGSYFHIGCGNVNGVNRSVESKDEADNETPTPVQQTQKSNIRQFTFSSTSDIEIKAGRSKQVGWVQPLLQDKSVFKPEDVVFVSEDSSVATIEYTKSALDTYLYFDITGVSSGETYIYVQSDDGIVRSDRIRVVVTGDNVTDVNASSEKDVANETADEKQLTLEDISFVELDDLQQLYCELPNLENRDEINDYVNKSGLSIHWFNGTQYRDSACYIGADYSAVTPRSRDRKGAVIDVNFREDGSIQEFGYLLDGSIPMHLSDFELKYVGGSFYYDGKIYENGEDAMQLYLANERN